MATRENHQFAGDARVPFSFGGAGNGRITITTNWPVADLTAANSQKLYKVAKAGYVSNFQIKADADMDTHATPTLTWDVGITGVTATDVDEFMAAVTGDEAFAGHDTNEVAETTELGTRVVAGDYITLATKGAGLTGAAGNVTVGFTFIPEGA